MLTVHREPKALTEAARTLARLKAKARHNRTLGLMESRPMIPNHGGRKRGRKLKALERAGMHVEREDEA